jgi:tRNA nucleotidyltransferase (CCA-adding enzyme)
MINKLEENGFEAYVVGGCVRDTLLGREPGDWDITTNARPEQVKTLFRRTIDTGIQHGTVTVMLDKCGYEVTTYRIDGEYEDSRHPKEVLFTAELKEDLKRRDFTINAMAYNHRSGIIDIFGGQGDLEHKVIRCVGNAEERFCEDALRIMRAIRFAGQLGFSIEENTLQAAKKLAPTLSNISAERVRIELVKLLTSAHPELLLTAWENGITKVILPEFDRMMETKQNNPHHCYTVGMHSMKVLEQLHAFRELAIFENKEKKFQIMCLAALFHDVAKPLVKTTDEQGIDHFKGHPEKGVEIVRKLLRRLKFDNETIDRTCRLVQWHDYRYSEKKNGMRRAVNKIGEDLMEELFLLQRCDVLAQSREYREEKLRILDQAEELFRQIQADGECTSLKTLAVSGSDLIKAGHRPGKQLGNTLQKLLEHVLEVPQDNEKQVLLEIADKIRKGQA